MEGDIACSHPLGYARVCPRSLPSGCRPNRCLRFDVEETPEVRAVWERHWAITDERLERGPHRET